MSRRSIFHFPVVHNQFQVHSLKINLHQARYLLINITSSSTQAQPLLMYSDLEPGLAMAAGNSPAGNSALLSSVLILPCSHREALLQDGNRAGSPQNQLLWGQLAQTAERKVVKQLEFVFLLHRLE